MKTMRRILSLLIAIVMTMGAVVPAFAAAPDDTAQEKVTETVTLHKLLMSKKLLDKWDPDQIQAGKKAEKEGDQDVAGYDGTQNLTDLNKIQEALYGTGEVVTEIPNVYFALKFASDYADKNLAGKYVQKVQMMI